MTQRFCEIPCPGRLCAGMLGVTVERNDSRADGHIWFGLTADPKSCPSCKSDWRVSPFPCPDQQTLAAAYAAGEPT